MMRTTAVVLATPLSDDLPTLSPPAQPTTLIITLTIAAQRNA
jgi:hypothetical protein